MSDQTQTTDIWLTTICCYLYGHECLWTIDETHAGPSRVTFTVGVPECDFDIIVSDFHHERWQSGYPHEDARQRFYHPPRCR
jgi:hypothetical protein